MEFSTTLLSIVEFIQKDAVGDQTLNVEVRRESTGSGGVTIISGDQTALSYCGVTR